MDGWMEGRMDGRTDGWMDGSLEDDAGYDLLLSSAQRSGSMRWPQSTSKVTDVPSVLQQDALVFPLLFTSFLAMQHTSLIVSTCSPVPLLQ